ncbi:YitT family protein [Paenibacillus senegalensis]|uniref:YitT family protein n=1 Tax=Paenibacillus senegalensis TaxID=1465766 RepID=UPI00028883B6|nr:YitT family protein [Paenibacillus senegalensis]
MIKLSLPYRQIIPILMGTAIYAFGLHYFVIPNEFMEGGMTGVALLINYATGIPPSLTTLVLNIPLFILGWRVLGSTSMILTIIGTLSLSLFLWVMEMLLKLGWLVPLQANDFFLVTLYAGVTLGTGLGIVFRYGGTTGGSDIVARIINKTRGLSMGQIILVIDAFVITSSLLYIAIEKILYTLVVVFIASRLIDFINQGSYAAKAFTIVTDHSQQLAEAITRELERGVTIFQAKGGYSKHPKEVVYCVVSRYETRKLRNLVKQIDPNAFLVVSDVKDVLGEGFTQD